MTSVGWIAYGVLCLWSQEEAQSWREIIEEAIGKPLEEVLPDSLWEFVKDMVLDFVKSNPVVVLLALWGAARSLGTTVQSGNTGLFFNLGRATRVLEPGFYFKIPFFQTIKTMPSRSRTMDVPNQKVTSSDGLVWFVDVNLVYRIVDVRKAIIEVAELEPSMEHMLALSVQEIVRRAGRQTLRHSGALDGELNAAMRQRLEPWGVSIESAGFTSVRPSPKTLRFTQQVHTTAERIRSLEGLEHAGLERGLAMPMLGSAPLLLRRQKRATQHEKQSRRRRRIRRSIRKAERESDTPVSARTRRLLRERLLVGATSTQDQDGLLKTASRRSQKLRDKSAKPSRT